MDRASYENGQPVQGEEAGTESRVRALRQGGRPVAGLGLGGYVEPREEDVHVEALSVVREWIKRRRGVAKARGPVGPGQCPGALA